jgi:hypothetical protein
MLTGILSRAFIQPERPVTSDDDLKSQEERNWDEARELIAYLRALEREYADPEKRGPLRQSVRITLNKVLMLASQLLGQDHWVSALILDLLGHLINKDVDFQWMEENSAYVARALYDSFRLDVLPEARDAQEVAGFLHELQRRCQDRSRDDEPLQDTVQQVLHERLTKAKVLLGEGHWLIPQLWDIFDALEHGNATVGLAREDARCVADVLEARFELYGGGGGDTGLNIKHLGLNSWKAFGFPIFMLWYHVRLLTRQEPHQYHHSGERG